jgi:hypothetical protein
MSQTKPIYLNEIQALSYVAYNSFVLLASFYLSFKKSIGPVRTKIKFTLSTFGIYAQPNFVEVCSVL